jgi:hypothetical protein
VCEYYNLVETDPEGYVSVGNQPGGGSNKSANWIQYVYSLEGKTLSGNNFFDSPQTPSDTLPPDNWANFQPASWATTQTVHASQQVEDTQSGLDVSTAEFDYSTDGGTHWRGWNAAAVTGADGITTPQVISADVPFGQDSGPTSQNQVRFRISDVAGNPGESSASPVLKRMVSSMVSVIRPPWLVTSTPLPARSACSFARSFAWSSLDSLVLSTWSRSCFAERGCRGRSSLGTL